MSKSSSPRPSAHRSAVAEPIEQLVALFAEHLPDVKFPGVDAAHLHALATALQDRADTLARAEAAWIAARDAHAIAQAELARTALAALGYARVYAADDPRLGAALAEIELRPAGAPRVTRAKRKTKPRTTDDRVTKLPFAGGGEPQSAVG